MKKVLLVSLLFLAACKHDYHVHRVTVTYQNKDVEVLNYTTKETGFTEDDMPELYLDNRANLTDKYTLGNIRCGVRKFDDTIIKKYVK